MGDLSEHFSRREFACRGESCCGHSWPVVRELVAGLEELRLRLCKACGREIPIVVTSGFRCRTHDYEEALRRGESEARARKRDSRHCVGEAADIVVRGVGVEIVLDEAERVEVFRQGGIGSYTGERRGMVHVDVRRDGPARWRE